MIKADFHLYHAPDVVLFTPASIFHGMQAETAIEFFISVRDNPSNEQLIILAAKSSSLYFCIECGEKHCPKSRNFHNNR